MKMAGAACPGTRGNGVSLHLASVASMWVADANDSERRDVNVPSIVDGRARCDVTMTPSGGVSG